MSVEKLCPPHATQLSDTLFDFGDGIYAIDAMYVRARIAAIHLIVSKGRAAFFDTGTNHSLPQVLDALERLGLPPSAVDYVIPSHVHLDHAGGAGGMMTAFPNAQLVVHPAGARHMADPSKLIAGTIAVYGEAAMRRLYGEIVPVPKARIVEAFDGQVLDLAGRTLRVLDTPGHARHHICLVDGLTGCAFTGDVFGLSYRDLDVDGRPSIIPTTTPVQFAPDAMRASIKRLLALQPPALYLTHFSRVDEVPRLGRDLLRLLDLHVAAAEAVRGLPPESRHPALAERLTALYLTEKALQGWRLDDQALLRLLAADIDLNAQGLSVWLDGSNTPISATK
jgi:glyoxylase-like metal-dependent hydrolase (beta-lactamase superfamily II)